MNPIKLTENNPLPRNSRRSPQARRAAQNVANRRQQNQTQPQPQANVQSRPLPPVPGPQQLTPQPQATMSATPLTSPQFNQPNNRGINNPPVPVQNSNSAPTQPQPPQPRSQDQSLTAVNAPNIRPITLSNPQPQNASVNTNTNEFNTIPNANRFQSLQQFGNNLANSNIANHFKNNMGFYGVAAGAIGAGLLLRRILNRTKSRQQKANYDAEGCGNITHPVERKRCMEHITSKAVQDLQNSKSYCKNVAKNERANCIQQIDQQIQELIATNARQNQNLF